VLDVDELRSFVFRSKDKVWVWIAMNRETREIVASACGDRTENRKSPLPNTEKTKAPKHYYCLISLLVLMLRFPNLG